MFITNQVLTNQVLKKVYFRIRKLTVIELFILLVMGLALVFSVRYFRIKTQWKTIYVEVVGRNWASSFSPYGYKTPFWMSDRLRVGQVEKGVTGKEIARIMAIDNFERGSEEAETYLTIYVRADLNTRTNEYIYKGRALNIGSAVEFIFNGTQVLGQIIDNDPPEGGYVQKNIVITGRLRNAEPWQISQIQVGDTMHNRVNGEIVAEILGITTEPPTSSVFFVSPAGGVPQLENNPRVKDAIITIRLKVFRKDDRWYFAGHQGIKVGLPLWIFTDNFNIQSLEIADIQESK